MSYRRFVFSILILLLFSFYHQRISYTSQIIFFDLFIAASSGTFIVFNLQAGIEGICQTKYVIQDDSKNNRATISKSKDLTDCQEKAVKNLGMAYMRPCPTCALVWAAWSHCCPAWAWASAQHSHCTDACGRFGLSGLTTPIPVS